MPWLLTHALHLGLILVGLVGVVALLAPQLIDRHTDRSAYRPPVSRDEHQRRVAALRASLGSGTPATAYAARGRTSLDGSSWRAFAVVSSMAAAIVHAAVAPHHFVEAGLLVGLFFVVAAAWQVFWAWQLSRRVTAERLLWGLAGNAGLIVLWAWSRTTGLPLGFTDGTEEIGPWDLSAVAWQLCVVVVCARALRTHARSTLVLGGLGAPIWTWAGLCGAVLVVLSLTAAIA